MNRIEYWEEKVKYYQSIIDSGKYDDYDVIGLQEAKDQLNYAWQDDELDERGLPHPWGW